jgi:hypothetical protein
MVERITHLDEDPSVPSDELLWLVTDYKSGDYDGEGRALGRRATGEFVEWDLSHCSCYGPFEHRPVEVSLEDINRELALEDTEWSKAIQQCLVTFPYVEGEKKNA